MQQDRKREINDIKIVKEEIRLSEFVSKIIVYMENMKEFTKKIHKTPNSTKTVKSIQGYSIQA